MKNIIIILSILGLNSCNKEETNHPKFKVGDCFTFTSDKDKIEKWTKPEDLFIFKVLEIGNNNYRTNVIIYNNILYNYTVSFSNDDIHSKIECGKYFK